MQFYSTCYINALKSASLRVLGGPLAIRGDTAYRRHTFPTLNAIVVDCLMNFDYKRLSNAISGGKYSKITLMYTYAFWPVPVMRAIFVVRVQIRRILISLKIYYNNSDINLVKSDRKQRY